MDLKEIKFKQTILPLWVPVFLYVLLILPSNLSSAFLIFSSIILILFISGFPFRHMVKMFLILMLLLSSFYFLAKTFPDQFPNRIDTWISRVENFNSTQNLDAS